MFLTLFVMLVKGTALSAGIYGAACVAWDVAAALGKKIYGVY